MFCEKCGKQLETGARFCPSCGAPVQEVHTEAEAMTEAKAHAEAGAQEKAQATAPAKPTGKFHLSRKLIIACVIGAVLLVLIACSLYSQRQKQKSLRTVTPDATLEAEADSSTSDEIEDTLIVSADVASEEPQTEASASDEAEKAEDAEADTSAKAAQSPEPAVSEEPEETLEEKLARIDVDNLVTNAYANVDMTGEAGSYYIPRINLDSEEIENINNRQYEALYAAMESGNCTSISYEWCVNGDVLSLAISTTDYTDNVGWAIYNISITEETVLDTDTFLERLDIAQEDYTELVKVALGSAFWDSFEVATLDVSSVRVADNYDFAVSQLAQTLSEQNITDAQPYLNSDGDLCIVGTVHGMIWDYTSDFDLLTIEVSPYYAETVAPEYRLVGAWSTDTGENFTYYTMTVTYSDGQLEFDVTGTNGYSHYTEWIFSGNLDSETGMVFYDNCVCTWTDIENAGASVTQEEAYRNGTGVVYLDGGYLYWTDNQMESEVLAPSDYVE